MVHGKYIEVEPIILSYLREKDCHFYYFCGGRGTGKTYGALDMCRKIGVGELHLDNDDTVNEKFLYLRRTGVEAQMCSIPEASPFKTYNRNEHYDISVEYNGQMGIGNFYLDSDKTKHIGYSCALSTFSNLRGVDFSDVTFILFDECIPEKGKRNTVKDIGRLLLNMLETVNRNRALEGRNEVVLCMLSNPIDLGDDLLVQLKFTSILNNMTFRGQQKYTDVERSLHIERYVNHRVSNEKRKTALYKFATDEFFEQSLSGEFTDNDMYAVRKVNLKDYTAFMNVDGVGVYKHKTDTLFHICYSQAPSVYEFGAYQREKVRELFYYTYKRLVINNLVTYDSYACKIAFEQMIHYKPNY